MVTGIAPARHDLLAVAPRDWAAVEATRAPLPALSDEAIALVRQWGQAERPLIVRRPMPGDPPGAVPAGLPLPPSVGKARVALAIPAHIAVHRVHAVPLRAARTGAPAAWHATIDAAVSLGEKLGLVPTVFGALLWQFLTDLAYLHPASDLDLLWPVGAPASIGKLLDGLAQLDKVAPMRIDGEIGVPVGAVNWRELAAARRGDTKVVLVKSLERAAFVPAADLLAREDA